LNSITFNENATATFSEGVPTNLNIASYLMDIGGANTSFLTPNFVGNGTITGTKNFTTADPSFLTALTGPGTAATSVDVSNSIFTQPVTIVSTFAPESVTYNFTPPGSVPEPGMLPVLGGILAVGMAAGARMRKAV
jgi:hypothetical protein